MICFYLGHLAAVRFLVLCGCSPFESTTTSASAATAIDIESNNTAQKVKNTSASDAPYSVASTKRDYEMMQLMWAMTQKYKESEKYALETTRDSADNYDDGNSNSSTGSGSSIEGRHVNLLHTVEKFYPYPCSNAKYKLASHAIFRYIFRYDALTLFQIMRFLIIII